MKFQIGDKVLIIHSNEQGEIIEIIDKEMVLINVHGVEFPIYIDQIDYPYFKQFTEKKRNTEQKSKIYIDQIPTEKQQSKNIELNGILLKCIPIFDPTDIENEIIKEIKLYLINQTSQSLQFIYQLNFFGKLSFELKNEVLANNNFYLHDIPFENWSDNPAFYFKFSLTHSLPNKAIDFETTIKIKPKQLFSKIENMKIKNEPAIVFPLFDDIPTKKEKDIIDVSISTHNQYKILSVAEAVKHIEQARSIIDLHIEKLTEQWQQLNNFEILQLQLQTFEKYYDLAIANYQPSLIVIHGIGTGRLRNEIHDILKQRTEVKSFINQYDPRFGYGATEIIFQY